MFDIGSVVAGRYRLVRKLGEGGMGAVYVAVQEPLGREVALKVILGDLARDPMAAERFQREARTLSALSHPNIVTIYDFGVADEGSLFLAMEFLRGESLRQRNERAGAFRARSSLPIVREVFTGLAVAHHAGVIHRDLKPDNIMLFDAPGRTDAVKLLDFGVAKSIATERGRTLTQAGMIVGTPGYMAPELVLHGITNDPRSDLYAMGVVWYEMLAGRPMFDAPTPMALVMRHASERAPSLKTIAGHVDGDISDLIDHLLEKQPDNRPSSAAEVIGLIDAAMQSGGRELLPRSLLPPSDPVAQSSLKTLAGPGPAPAFTPPGPLRSPPPPASPQGTAPGLPHPLQHTPLSPSTLAGLSSSKPVTIATGTLPAPVDNDDLERLAGVSSGRGRLVAALGVVACAAVAFVALREPAAPAAGGATPAHEAAPATPAPATPATPAPATPATPAPATPATPAPATPAPSSTPPSAKLATASSTPSSTPAGPLPTTLSQQQLEAPVQKASAAVGTCLSREAATNPDAPSMLTLRFEVTPAGDALNVLVEPPALRSRPVLGCLQRVLADLSWPASASTSRAMMGLKMPVAAAKAAPAPAPASPVTTTPATRTKPRLKD